MAFRCSMCSFQAVDNDSLVSHVCKIHRHDPNFLIYCSQCLRSFRVWETFKKHRYRGCKEETASAASQSYIYEDEPTMDTSEIPEESHYDDHEMNGPMQLPHQWHAAKFILSIKERHTLSQSAVDCILESTSSLMSSINMGILNELKSSGNIPDDIMHQLELKFDNTESLFSGLSTPHQQQKYFHKKFHKIEPVCKLFGHRYVWKRGTTRRRRRVERVEDTFQYIPLLDSLKALLRKPEIHDEVEYGHQAPPGILRDYCDGDFVKNHPLVKKNPKALLLAMYFDDLEVVNPLGSRRGKHKLGMFYWMLLNIHPAYRSTLHTIQLLAIAKSSHIRTYGIDAVFKPVIADLKTLAEAGISVELADGTCRHYTGCLVTFLGDTPASALAGGFKEGVGGAYRCCSTCMITSSTLSSVLDESALRLRNIEQHRIHCSLLDLQESSREYGVNRLSILNEAPHFDLCKCLPHDIMHVILEGVLSLHCKLLLVHCIDSHYFSLKTLNRLITEFEYGYSEAKNIPRQLDNDHLRSAESKLSQSASQMWLLGRSLPFIVGKYVPSDDKHWKCFTQLLRILTIVTATEITDETVSVLSLLIREYLFMFKSLYPHCFTPKLHYLLHLALQMLLFGPLRHQWCMRLEAKNAFIKGLVGKCFKNLPYTIAERHQNYMCLRLLSSPGSNSTNFLYRGDEIGPVTYTPSDDATLPSEARNTIAQSFPSQDVLRSTKSIVVLGKEFRPGAIICMSPPSNQEYPTFGEIVRIFVQDETKCLLIHVYHTESYCFHYNAYQVAKDHQYRIVSVRQLGIHDIFHKHTVSSQLYISIKSHHHVEYEF